MDTVLIILVNQMIYDYLGHRHVYLAIINLISVIKFNQLDLVESLFRKSKNILYKIPSACQIKSLDVTNHFKF